MKVYGGQKVISGNIIVRQKGNNFWPSLGVSQGHDFTLFATQEGVVRYFVKKKKRFDGRMYRCNYVTVEA